MMPSVKLTAGQRFPKMAVAKFGGGEVHLGSLRNPNAWQLVVVYRGKHCPLCTTYLSELNEVLPELQALNVEVVAVSVDPEEKVRIQMDQVKPNFEVGYGLSIEQMQALGLYISNPRSSEEHDRPFAEPGLIVINSEGTVQIIDISNAPFTRPDLKTLVMGIKFIRNPDNNYPIRGTYQ